MRIIVAAAVCGSVLLPGRSALAENAIAQEVQKLQASAPQLLSLRDFLGPLNREFDVEASGAGVFILRDASSMAYGGEFTIRQGPQGSIEIERVTGAAALDNTRAVKLPALRLDSKARAQVAAGFAGSQMAGRLSAGGAETDRASAPATPPVPSQMLISALRMIGPNGTGLISQSKAVFFRDGSGYVQGFRAQLMQTASLSPVLRVADAYYSAIKGDGAHVWRDAIVEAGGDAQLSVSDLELHCSCPMGADCKTAERWLLSSGVHVIKRSHQLVSSVPPQLLSQMAPAVPPVAPISAAAGAPQKPAASAPGAGRPSSTTDARPSQPATPNAPPEDDNTRSL